MVLRHAITDAERANMKAILMEIHRQFKCRMAFSIDKKQTLDGMAESADKMFDSKTCKSEISFVVGDFLRQHPIPDGLMCLDILDFVCM